MFKRLVVFCEFFLFDAGCFYIAQSGSEFSVFLKVGKSLLAQSRERPAGFSQTAIVREGCPVTVGDTLPCTNRNCHPRKSYVPALSSQMSSKNLMMLDPRKDQCQGPRCSL